MKIDIIKFWTNSQLTISILGLFIVVTCLYVLTVLPAISRNRVASVELKERKAEIGEFLANPPSRKRIIRLLEEKEMLVTQHIEVAKKIGFPRPDPLLNFPIHFDGMEMDALINSFGIRVLHDYFKKELKKRESSLRHLEDVHRIIIPPIIGLEKNEPETPQELALLLAGAEMAERLITIAINVGTREISSIKMPPPLYKDGATQEFKKLNIELILKMDATALIEFLDQLITGEHFFVIEKMEISPTATPELGIKLSISTQVFLGG